MWTCRFCETENHDQDIYCRGCQKRKPDTIRCRKCGRENIIGNKYCFKCGARLQGWFIWPNWMKYALPAVAAAFVVVLLVSMLPREKTPSPKTDNQASSRFEKVIPTAKGFIAIKPDGSTYTSCLEEEYNESVLLELDSWTNLVDIKCSYLGILGLKANGTVLYTGSEAKSKAVEKWENIVAIDIGYEYIYGLKSDGTVLSLDYEEKPVEKISNWKNIKQIKAARCDAGESFLALTEDGKILDSSEGEFVLTWSGENCDVVSLESSGWLHVGLKSDGTVICAGIDKEVVEDEIAGWRNITQLCPGDCSLFALTNSGEVLVAGAANDIDELHNWSDIRKLYVSEDNSIIAGIDKKGFVSVLYRNDNEYRSYGFSRGQNGVSEIYLISDYGNPRIIGFTEEGSFFVNSIM